MDDKKIIKRNETSKVVNDPIVAAVNNKQPNVIPVEITVLVEAAKVIHAEHGAAIDAYNQLVNTIVQSKS